MYIATDFPQKYPKTVENMIFTGIKMRLTHKGYVTTQGYRLLPPDCSRETKMSNKMIASTTSIGAELRTVCGVNPSPFSMKLIIPGMTRDGERAAKIEAKSPTSTDDHPGNTLIPIAIITANSEKYGNTANRTTTGPFLTNDFKFNVIPALIRITINARVRISEKGLALPAPQPLINPGLVIS